MNRRIILCLTTLMTGLVSGVPSFAAETEATAVLIAHPKFPRKTLSEKEFSSIMLGKDVKIDAVRARPFVLGKGASCRQSFFSLMKLSEKEAVGRWISLSFSGAGTAPEIIETEIEMIAKIKSTAGAVGFVCSGTEIGSVKGLQIVNLER